MALLKLFLLVLLVLGPTASLAFADTLSGLPTVTDGDTLRFKSGIRVRLFGIDTPEKNQRCELNSACYRCGEDAAKYVRELIGKNEVACELTGDKTYERYVAICSVGKRDLAEHIIGAGWGFPYQEFLKGHPLESRYSLAQTSAQNKKLGMHRGRFISPADWRNHKMRLECER